MGLRSSSSTDSFWNFEIYSGSLVILLRDRQNTYGDQFRYDGGGKWNIDLELEQFSWARRESLNLVVAQVQCVKGRH